MQIGKKIKNLRLKKGLTQEELGERTDLSKGYISQLEHDLSSPSIDTFFNIFEVLGCTPKQFLMKKKESRRLSTAKWTRLIFLMKNEAMKFNGLFRSRMKRKWNRFVYARNKWRV